MKILLFLCFWFQLLACLTSVRLDRYQLKDQLLLTSKESNASAIQLLEVLVLLVDPKLPWSCNMVGYLFQNNAFALLREIILTAKVTFYLLRPDFSLLFFEILGKISCPLDMYTWREIFFSRV